MNNSLRQVFSEKYKLLERAREIAQSRPLTQREVQVLLSLRRYGKPLYRSANAFYNPINSLQAAKSADSREIDDVLQFAGRGNSAIDQPEFWLGGKASPEMGSPTYRPATAIEASLLYADIHSAAPKKCIDEWKEE